jgi:hypothetical protein
MTQERKLQIIAEELNKLGLEEDWKSNIMAAVIAAAGLVGGSGKAKAQDTKTATTQSVSTNTMKSSFGNLFQSGQYLFDSGQKELIKNKLEDIGNFLKNNPNATFEIGINSSESQVPNSGVNMKPGELADKRAKSVEELIKVFVKNLKDKDVFTGEVKFSSPTITIGKTDYKKGDNPKDEKFTKEQFVNLDIKIVSKGADKSKTADYSDYSSKKEPIYSSNKLVGMIRYPNSKTADIKKSGQVNTGVQDLIFQPINPDTGKPSGEDVKVPSDWWNKTVSNNTVSGNTLSKIKAGQFN